MLLSKSNAKNPEAKNKTLQMQYRKHQYLVLYRQRIRYYGSTMHIRTTKLVRYALHCTTQKLQNNQLCKHQIEQDYQKGMLFLMRTKIGCEIGICKENKETDCIE